MTVVARMRDGTTETLDAALGSTPEDVARGLTQDNLTGSAVPLDEAWLRTEDGSMIRYADISRLDPAP